MGDVENTDTSFDGQLSRSDVVNFLPYVGVKYRTEKRRILMVGESHYGSLERNSNRSLTRSVVEDDYLKASKNGRRYNWTKCFRRVAAMVSNGDYYNSDAEWQKLCFYNFFQTVIGTSPKDKSFLTESSIATARASLNTVCKCLEPHLVIVWGYGRLYDTWMPQDQETMDSALRVFRYAALPGIVFWSIHHPSAGFSIRAWKSKYDQVASMCWGANP